MRKPGPHAVEASFRALSQRTRDVLARGETISSVAVFKDRDIAPASVLLEAAVDGAPKGTVRLELLARPDQTCELPRGTEFELCAGREVLGCGRIAGTLPSTHASRQVDGGFHEKPANTDSPAPSARAPTAPANPSTASKSTPSQPWLGKARERKVSAAADEMATERNQLLIAITRCSHVEDARSDPAHSCDEVVGSQAGDVAELQVPEPWSGHIDRAPILFVGSNPSISKDEDFPTVSWDEAKTISFFQRRFDPGGPVTPQAFNRVKYWTGARKRAEELLERDAVPGKDFALTEVVHCKSKKEAGVEAALSTCTRAWLDKVVSQSAARVVVLLGRYAKDACAKRWGIDAEKSVHFDVAVAGRSRAVVILPHPNAREQRKLRHHATEEERRQLRAVLE